MMMMINESLQPDSLEPDAHRYAFSSAVARGKSIVRRAQVLPFLGDGVRSGDFRYVFSKDESETKVKMPVNVTMQEPRTWVIGFEANGNVIAWTANADYIPNDGIVVVVIRAVRTADNGEIMAVKMERMGSASNIQRWQAELNHAIGLEWEHTPFWKELLSHFLPTEDL